MDGCIICRKENTDLCIHCLRNFCVTHINEHKTKCHKYVRTEFQLKLSANDRDNRFGQWLVFGRQYSEYLARGAYDLLQTLLQDMIDFAKSNIIQKSAAQTLYQLSFCLYCSKLDYNAAKQLVINQPEPFCQLSMHFLSAKMQQVTVKPRVLSDSHKVIYLFNEANHAVFIGDFTKFKLLQGEFQSLFKVQQIKFIEQFKYMAYFLNFIQQNIQQKADILPKMVVDVKQWPHLLNAKSLGRMIIESQVLLALNSQEMPSLFKFLRELQPELQGLENSHSFYLQALYCKVAVLYLSQCEMMSNADQLLVLADLQSIIKNFAPTESFQMPKNCFKFQALVFDPFLKAFAPIGESRQQFYCAFHLDRVSQLIVKKLDKCDEILVISRMNSGYQLPFNRTQVELTSQIDQSRLKSGVHYRKDRSGSNSRSGSRSGMKTGRYLTTSQLDTEHAPKAYTVIKSQNQRLLDTGLTRSRAGLDDLLEECRQTNNNLVTLVSSYGY